MDVNARRAAAARSPRAANLGNSKTSGNYTHRCGALSQHVSAKSRPPSGTDLALDTSYCYCMPYRSHPWSHLVCGDWSRSSLIYTRIVATNLTVSKNLESALCSSPDLSSDTAVNSGSGEPYRIIIHTRSERRCRGRRSEAQTGARRRDPATRAARPSRTLRKSRRRPSILPCRRRRAR